MICRAKKIRFQMSGLKSNHLVIQIQMACIQGMSIHWFGQFGHRPNQSNRKNGKKSINQNKIKSLIQFVSNCVSFNTNPFKSHHLINQTKITYLKEVRNVQRKWAFFQKRIIYDHIFNSFSVNFVTLEKIAASRYSSSLQCQLQNWLRVNKTVY